MVFDYEKYCDEIFRINSDSDFEKQALSAFCYQYENNILYSEFCDTLGVKPENVKNINEIPFIPVEFFKSHNIITGEKEITDIFTSSGTTGSVSSKHNITDISVYERSFLKAFELFYGKPEEYTVIGLLPSYLERTGSSLIYMVDKLISISNSSESGFFLHDFENLVKLILNLEKQKKKYILIGVSFALLDLAEKHSLDINNGIIMETGGMKGKRKEIIRADLHKILKNSFGAQNIHSEYGMTELLSQAYSKGNGLYNCPPWMKVMVRKTDDPLSVNSSGKGAINIIDLANINSCCFIATSDLGKVNNDKSFEVSGRFDNSDVRGCNLMVY